MRSVAVRHGVCESLLFTWRRQVDDGVLAPEMPMFVQMLEPVPAMAGLLSHSEPRSIPPCSGAVGPVAAGLIETELGADRSVWIGSDVNLAALRA